MMSRFYYLMDGNSMPRQLLHVASQAILCFVHGHNSTMPYSLLSAPLSEGGLDCPSLMHRKLAYDTKFIADSISTPLDTPWKLWLHADLSQAAFLTTCLRATHKPTGLNPLLQHHLI